MSGPTVVRRSTRNAESEPAVGLFARYAPRSLLQTLLVLASMLAPWGAHAAVEVSVSPTKFTAGASVKISAEGLSTSTSYRLRLEPTAGGTSYTLTEFDSGSSDSRLVTQRIPNAAIGSYNVVLYRYFPFLTKLTEVPVKLVAKLPVALSPTSAPPGKAVRIEVGNLVSGAVRVKYAGKTVLGPVTVGDGEWIGKFVVPSDRPASLPASVPLEVENIVGRSTVAKIGTATFSALAPSTAPRLSLLLSGSPTGAVDRGSKFPLSGTLKTDDNEAPDGRSRAYWRPPGGTLIPLDTEVVLAGDGSFTMEARAPDYYRDAYAGYGDKTGDLVIVNQGTDKNTDSASDYGAVSTQPPKIIVEGDNGGSATFSLVLRGSLPDAPDPLLPNVIVEAKPDYRSAFGYAGLASGGSGNDDRYIAESFALNQFTPGLQSEAPVTANSYGCDRTVFRRTSNSLGKVTFTINIDTLKQANFVNAAEDCFQDGPCGGLQNRNSTSTNGKATSADIDGAISFVLQIYAAHLGYRSTGVSIGYLPDTAQFVNITTGELFVNNSTEVLLERSQASDVDLRNLRIDGLGGPAKKQPVDCDGAEGGVCFYKPYRFGVMYTYPDTAKWPTNRITAPGNSGRKVRLQVDPTVTGTLTSGKLKLTGYPTVTFADSGTVPACVLDNVVPIEYVASLPDLTRAPVGQIAGTVELTFGAAVQPPIPFVLLTQLPPTGIDFLNPNIETLTIDALNDKLTGTYKPREADIPVDSPGYDIAPLDNQSMNTSDFNFQRTSDKMAAKRIKSVSNNDVAGNAGGPKASAGVFFGFTDENYDTPEPVVLFDTGLIPLFRYTWGIDPIAGATLGADFWMASELAYYGELRSAGMNATVDPTVAGGIDIFFDLDILLGLVSASITAETALGVTMRTVIGDGGLAHVPGSPVQQNGECFFFDLDLTWEACAAGICGGGTECLIRVREGSGCDSGGCGSARPQNKALSELAGFDLKPPNNTASALATDGRGNSISLGVTAAGALVATHLSSTIEDTTRTIAAATVGVQHLDVAFHGINRAMAVWSENTRSTAEIQGLIQSQGGQAFDEIARTQRLRYAYWDGTAWSAPANLTTAGSDGKPQLAGCIRSTTQVFSQCPSGGEITAVWEHDANGDLNAPDLEIHAATWNPTTATWTTPARVSDAGVSSDMLPSVAYKENVPMVVWVRNPAGQYLNLSGRQVAYRFLNSTQKIATALGTGVGWVSHAVNNTGEVVIAYTQAQDGNGFVGNRQALKVARAFLCTSSCSFQVTEPRDANGRQYRVERPTAMFDATGKSLVGFRALGFGPNNAGKVGLKGDPPGTLLGTGELGVVRLGVAFSSQTTAQFVPLSGDGLAHWKPDMVFDDTVDSVMSVSMDAVAPIGAARSKAMRFMKAYSPDGVQVHASAKSLTGGSTLRVMNSGPDFVLRTPVLSSRIVSAGQTPSLAIKLVNQGQDFDPAVHGSLQVVASWNAPAGAGVPAGSFALADTVAANGSRSLSIPLTVPAGITNDRRQTLFIDIVADEDANAIGGVADQLREVVNLMPVPQDVNVDTRLDSTFVNVTWDAVVDARVVGWRVWRLDQGSSTWKHVGSTTLPGFVDIYGRVGEEVQYKVAAYSNNGMESEPSAPAWGLIEASRPDAVFSNGFESAPIIGPNL